MDVESLSTKLRTIPNEREQRPSAKSLLPYFSLMTNVFKLIKSEWPTRWFNDATLTFIEIKWLEYCTLVTLSKNRIYLKYSE